MWKHALRTLLVWMGISSFLRPQSTLRVLSPRALVEKAILQSEGIAALSRYTYFMLSHDQNRSRKGKVFLDTKTLYEYTWIHELPYGRIMESGGRPLQGKALADENARYEKATADRKALDSKERADENHFRYMDTSLYLRPLLTSAYELREIGQETLSGSLTHIIDCVPTHSDASTSSSASRHVVLWINDSGLVLKDTFEIILDEPGKKRGSYGREEFQLIDGSQLPLHTSFHLIAPNGNTGDFEKSYSRFRRFNVSVQVIPAD